jgi:uncharacterized membrane protein YdfJ with MMPL/SSD domain
VRGNLSGVLNFTPQPIDPLVLVLLFAVIFGLSMDYEVFMLTRVQEHYLRTGDTREAVAAGIQRGGRLITAWRRSWWGSSSPSEPWPTRSSSRR